jgi:endonuclease III
VIPADLVSRLVTFYGPLPTPPADAFGVYLWDVLGIRTTAGRRDAALQALRRVPAMTPDSVRKLGRGRLEAIARLSGPFAEERVSAIETGVDVFRRRRDFAAELDGPLRRAWLAAGDLPHLGEAGSARLLLFASRHGLVPVDVGVSRFAVRFGLVEPLPNLRRLSRTVRRRLAAALPSGLSDRRQAVLYLAHHAQSTCVEVEPHCSICPLVTDCAEGRERSSAAGN